MTITCQWYAMCDNDADGTVEHPVLGPVPTCKRCADKHGATLTPFPAESPLRAYDVRYEVTGDERDHTTRCLTEEGVTGPSDFPRMIGIRRGVAETNVRILAFHPTTL